MQTSLAIGRKKTSLGLNNSATPLSLEQKFKEKKEVLPWFSKDD